MILINRASITCKAGNRYHKFYFEYMEQKNGFFVFNHVYVKDTLLIKTYSEYYIASDEIQTMAIEKDLIEEVTNDETN